MNGTDHPSTTGRSPLGRLVPPAALSAIGWGGLVAGTLDAIDGVVAYGFLGLNPIQVLQYIASGALGDRAFSGGLPAAGVGVVVHYGIAFTVAAVFYAGTRLTPLLTRHAVAAGLAYGSAVFLVMNYLVLPHSAVSPSPFSLPLALNGLVGHAVFVGLPISWFARRAATAAADATP